ncbi:MAG: DUF2723 domain-containing protein [Acidobacteriota bacterium]
MSERDTTARDQRREARVTAALVLGAFGLHAWGACPVVFSGDSGDMATAVALLDIPHATGYPLYVLLGKLFTWLVPIGSVALRLSLFSAVTAAVSCGLVHRLALRLGLTGWLAAWPPLLLATSVGLWSQATIQRVYTLHALLVLVALWCCFRFEERPSRGALALTAFACALATTNHLLAAPLTPLAIGHSIWRRPALLRDARAWLLSATTFVLGLLPYAYLPIRSRAPLRLDWGNPETPENFWKVLTREGFWKRAHVESWRDGLDVTLDYLVAMGRELGWVGLLLVPLAVGWSRVAWRVRLLLLGVALTNFAIMFAHGAWEDLFVHRRYHVGGTAALTLLAGLGAGVLLRDRWRRLAPLLLLLPSFYLVRDFSRHDRSDYLLIDGCARAVLDSLPPGSMLLAGDANLAFAIAHVHLVEGHRPDVHLVLLNVDGRPPANFRFDPRRDHLHFTHPSSWPLGGLAIEPAGLTYRVVTPGADPEVPDSLPELPAAGGPVLAGDYASRQVIGHLLYLRSVSLMSRDRAAGLAGLDEAMDVGHDAPRVHHNSGISLLEQGEWSRARQALERAAELRPKGFTGHDENLPAQALERLTEIEALLPEHARGR